MKKNPCLVQFVVFLFILRSTQNSQIRIVLEFNNNFTNNKNKKWFILSCVMIYIFFKFKIIKKLKL